MLRFQMTSDNGGLFFRETIKLCTTEMPSIRGIRLTPWLYESCIFTPTDNEVVGTYFSLSEAIEGHKMLTEKYGLGNMQEDVIED